MSNSSTLSTQRNTEEIRPDRWIPFLAEFTRDNRGAHARLETIGANADAGDLIETEDRPFDGVSADVKDRERTIWISFGASADKHLTHGVHNATLIRTLAPAHDTGPVLEIETTDGTKTILQLSNPEANSLPPR